MSLLETFNWANIEFIYKSHTTIDRKITRNGKKKTMKPLNIDENDDNE
jgi:hypothetical protein